MDALRQIDGWEAGHAAAAAVAPGRVLASHGDGHVYRWASVTKPLTALTVQAMPLEEALRGAVEHVSGLSDVWVTGADAAPAPVYLVVIGELGIEALDGVFTVDSAPGAGTRVRAVVPCG